MPSSISNSRALLDRIGHWRTKPFKSACCKEWLVEIFTFCSPIRSDGDIKSSAFPKPRDVIEKTSEE